jgi:hypothetical protein
VVLVEFGQNGIDLRFRCPQCGVLGSVLVGGCTDRQWRHPRSVAALESKFPLVEDRGEA